MENIIITSKIEVIYNIETKEVTYCPITIHSDIIDLPSNLIIPHNGNKVFIKVDRYEFVEDKTIYIYPEFWSILEN